MNGRMSIKPFLFVAKIMAVILLIVAQFGVGVLLDRFSQPAQGMAVQPILATQAASVPAGAEGGGTFSKILPSYTALIFPNPAVYLPAIFR